MDKTKRRWCKMSDFEDWLNNTKNLLDLSEEIGANWALVSRFLVSYLKKHGFTVLSEREIEKIRKG